MNDYACYYFLCGLAYAIIAEYNYRQSDEFDPSAAWSVGEIFGTTLEAIYNSLFWPKLIVDGMIEAYFSAFDDEDES